VVGETLSTKAFGAGTTGFCASEDASIAVCLLPGTEIAFEEIVEFIDYGVMGVWHKQYSSTNVARFRQINKDQPSTHHDALEFGEGEFVLLTRLREGQKARVLQLPAAPKTAAEVKEQERLPVTA